jgi:hypothetical protein
VLACLRARARLALAQRLEQDVVGQVDEVQQALGAGRGQRLLQGQVCGQGKAVGETSKFLNLPATLDSEHSARQLGLHGPAWLAAGFPLIEMSHSTWLLQ